MRRTATTVITTLVLGLVIIGPALRGMTQEMAASERPSGAPAASRLEARALEMTGAPALRRAHMLARAGRLWLMSGEAARALAAQTEGLVLAPDHVGLLIDRGVSLIFLGRHWEALDDLYHALDLEPGNIEALVFRAGIYRELDALDLAEDDLDRVLEIEPGHVDALYERGEVRFAHGDIAGARADWMRVVGFAPGAPTAGAARARLDEFGDGARMAGQVVE
jgi:tetratricopeptide (TPR) repeat protein